MQATYVQRLRVKFSKIGPARFIGHLDVSRTWERALNRAKIPMAYTQGFNRRPKMQFAGALPLGSTSDCEYVDLWLTDALEPAQALAQLSAKMAPGIVLKTVEEVFVRQPALPTLTTDAIYRAEVAHAPLDRVLLQERIVGVLSAENIPCAKKGRKNKGKVYNLRPLIIDITLLPDTPFPTMEMCLLAKDNGQMGRPDEVLGALEIDPLDVRIHRVELRLDPDKLTQE